MIEKLSERVRHITMGKIKIKAISFGVLVDILGSLVTALLLFFIAAPFMSQRISSPSEFAVMTNILQKNPYFMAIAIFIGLLWSCAGGFATGSLAKGHEILNSICAGLVLIILGVVFYVFFPSPYPIWINLLFLILTITAVIYGGFLSLRHPEKALNAATKIRGIKWGLGIIIGYHVFQLYFPVTKIIYMEESEVSRIVVIGIISLIVLGFAFRLEIARISLLTLTVIYIISRCFLLTKDISEANWIKAIFVSCLVLVFNFWIFVYLRKPSIKQLFHPIFRSRREVGKKL
jgi:hypothetical protein